MSKNSKWTKLLFPILTISSLPLISVACDRKDKPVTPTPEPQPEPNPNPSNPEQPVNPNPTPEPQPEPEIPVNPGTDIDENNAELLSKKKQELWDLIEEYNNLRQEYFRLVGKLSIENEKSYPYYSLKILIGDPKLSEVIEAYEGLSKTKEALLNDIEPLKTRGMLYYLNELSNLRSKLLYNKYILMEYEQDVTKYDELLNVYYEKTSSTDFWEISAYYTNVDLAAYEAERQATKVKIEWYSSKKLAFDELMNNLALLKSKYIEHNYLDDSFDDVENITWNDKESRVDVLNKISDLEEKYNKLNDRFERLLSSENEIRNTLIEKIKPSLANYEAIVPNLDILSIDNNNISAYVKNLKTGDDSVVIKDISIDENDNHILNITYGISYYIDTKREFTITKQIIFNKDIQPKLDAIVYENLDELFDINYDKLSQSYLSNLRDDIEQLFIKKHNIVNKYFEYMMDIDSIQYRDNKIFADIQFINKNKVLKTITLSSNQTVSFLDEATKNIRFNFSDEFKASQYYLNGMESSNRINYYLLNFVNPEVQRLSKSLTFLNLVNNGFEGEQILTYDEKIDILNRFLKSFVQLDSTSHINQEAIANWEITNIDNEFIYKIDNSSNTLKFAVLVTSATGAQYKSHIDVRSKDYAKIIEDSNNEKEILKLISSSTAGNIFKTFEYDEITNSDVIASVGYAHFNEIFRLPRHGRYALVLQPKYQPKIDDVKGTLTLKFTYTKDGVVVNQNNPANISKEFTLSYFKPLTADDIYPKNSNAWFTDADFTGYEKPPVDIQNKINSINGTDFEYNLTDGKKLIDVDILLKQKAFNKLRYLFNFTGEIAKTDENNGKFGTDGFNKETEIAPTINKEKIHLSTDKETDVNVNSLLKDYFVYYYNVRGGTRNNLGTLTFKLGFIKKTNTNIRFSTTQEITLINLKNDLKTEIYPEVMVNRLTLNDLQLRYENDSYGLWKGLSSYLPTDIVDMFNNEQTRSLLDNLISVREIQKYNNYAIRNSAFKVAEVKLPNNANGTIFIRMKYSENNVEKQGNQWFKISGLKRDGTIDSSNLSNYELAKQLDPKLTTFNHKMTKIFLDDANVYRNRHVELSEQENNWRLESNKREVNWYLSQPQYIKPYLKYNTDFKIQLHLFAGPIVLDDLRSVRIRELNTGINVDFNWSDLINGEVVKHFSYHFDTKNGPIDINATLNIDIRDDYDIRFKLTLDNPEYKFAITDYTKNTRSSLWEVFDASNSEWNTFNPEKAFYIDKYASYINVEYVNNIGNEVFSDTPTNVIDYKNMSYTQENQPLVLYSEGKKDRLFKYDPNQNLFYKFHEGYKFNNEFLHDSYIRDHSVGEILWYKSLAFNRGSTFAISSVSDKNPGLFYFITNNHVIDNPNNTGPQNNSFNGNYLLTRNGNNFENNRDAGFGYWGGLYADYIQALPVWTGRNQINKDGIVTNNFVDLSVFIVDIKKIIEKAKEDGRFQTAKFYEHWFEIPSDMYSPSSLSYNTPFKKYNSTELGFIGYPYGKKAGYIINRVDYTDNRHIFNKQSSFMPTFYNAGNSGTGVIDSNGTYVTTINSGSPLKSLTAWDVYTKEYNYLGLHGHSYSVEDIPQNSLFANILKLNADNPSLYKLNVFTYFIEEE